MPFNIILKFQKQTYKQWRLFEKFHIVISPLKFNPKNIFKIYL